MDGLACKTQPPVRTLAQSGLLFILAKADGATKGQLASALNLAPSAVSGSFQMEALSWVARRPCPQRVWLQAPGTAQLPLILGPLGTSTSV